MDGTTTCIHEKLPNRKCAKTTNVSPFQAVERKKRHFLFSKCGSCGKKKSLSISATKYNELIAKHGNGEF